MYTGIVLVGEGMIRLNNYKITSNIKFTSNKNNKEQKTEQKRYTDPLMKWPARGLAYTNELGAALSEVAPKLGTLLWFPAMLYFGADIYDKYKNEKTSYDPNAKRGTEQAIFQLLASVLLPTGAVITGQKVASVLGVMGKTGLSLQSREEIINFLQGFTSRRHIEKFKGNIDTFKELFKESISTKRDKLIREGRLKNPVRMFGDAIFGKRHPESLAMSQKDRVLAFADKHIDEMFNIYSNLEQNQKPQEFSDKLWNKFIKLKDKYSRDPDYKATALRDAAEDIIKQYQKNKIMRTKILKTVGGFVALGLAINPIDKFVENVIIKRFVEPNLGTVFHQNSATNNQNA